MAQDFLEVELVNEGVPGAIEGEAIDGQQKLSEGDVYTLLWAWWRNPDAPYQAWRIFGTWCAKGVFLSVMSLGMMTFGSESDRNALGEEKCRHLLANEVPHLDCVVSGIGVEAQGPPPSFGGGAEAWRPNRGNNYPKLAQLVHAVEALCTSSGFDAIAVLSAIESFALECRTQWLKVAAGSKASMIEDAVTGSIAFDVALELGTFVGYTTMRLAVAGERTGNADAQNLQRVPTVTSFEVDPVHVSVARHFLRIGLVKSSTEVWTGQVKDVTFRLVDLGASSVTFLFMDHCGTAFHDDTLRLARANFLATEATVVADNVLEPGAPEFAWMFAVRKHRPAITWALFEFGSTATEDWMIMCCPVARQFCEWLAS